MTVQEIQLLKQWLTCEELRLAQSVDYAFACCQHERSPSSAVHYFESCIVYNEFRRCMRSLDMLLHIFP